MLQKLALALLFCSLTYISAENSYEGYKIYDINAKNEFQKNVLLRLSANEDYDFFKLPKSMHEPARVLIKPNDQVDFESALIKFSLDFEVNNEDIGKTIEEENVQNGFTGSISRAGKVSFDKYLRFAEINAYLDELAKSYPNRVFVKTEGKSYEGRDLKSIVITNGDSGSNKKVIYVDGGIYAREWIAPAGALYVINQLVENYAANAHLLKNYDWIVLPVVNPDGYEYTHTSARLWRKTRKPVNGSPCIGTNGNRNFNFHWGEVGTTSDPCTDLFKGETAFSEPETQVVRNILHSISGIGKMYLTLHSYGNNLLYPWGYTTNVPQTWLDLDEIVQAGANAIRASTGTQYTVGSYANEMYPASGGSADYAFGKANIPIAITMELPAGGQTGFDPTPNQIKPFVSEAWTGIKAMAEKVIEKY